MKLPVEYKQNLQKGIITEAMLESCLLGVNKRAKNCRNAIRHLNKSMDYSRYLHQKQKYNEKLQTYYEIKYRLLSVLTPVAIHYESYEGNGKKCEEGRQKQCAAYDPQHNQTTYFYLFFQTANHSYHYPISQEEVQRYPHLSKIFIKDHIVTDGLNEEEMVSMEFVMEVLKLIQNQDGTCMYHKGSIFYLGR